MLEALLFKSKIIDINEKNEITILGQANIG